MAEVLINQKALEAAARAMYDHQVAAARKEVDDKDFEIDELPQIFRRLAAETDTAQVLVFGSYFETKFRSAFRHNLRHVDTPAEEESVFGVSGPLSTFSSRITLAFQLGWISQSQRDRINAFRKIRNEFAHRAYATSYDDDRVVGLFENIDIDVPGTLDVLRNSQKDTSYRMLEFNELTPRQVILCKFAFLAEGTFREMLIAPTALYQRVMPHDVVINAQGQSEMARRVARAAITAVFELVAKP